jgi:hypothetical protein
LESLGGASSLFLRKLNFGHHKFLKPSALSGRRGRLPSKISLKRLYQQEK